MSSSGRSLGFKMLGSRMAEHFRSGPDKTVERPIIGRRTSECQVDCVKLNSGPVELLKMIYASSVDMPCADELLVVSEIFKRICNEKAEGRDKFLARVAANSLT